MCRAVLTALLGVFAICMMFSAPIETKANEIYANEDIYVEAQLDVLEYASWVTRDLFQVPIGAEDYGHLGEVNMSRIDHVETNARIRFYLSNVRSGEWLGELKYLVDLYFDFDVDGQMLSSSHVRLNVYTVDVHTNTMSLVYGNIAFNVDGYTSFVSEFPLLKDVDIIVLEFEFNIHEVYGGDVGQDPRFQTWLSFGSVSIRTESYLPNIPSFDSPDLDLGDLDSIASLRPSGVLALFFNKLTSYSYVLTLLCLGMTLGVIAFVLFGEKK